jgi:hypothetical protein
VNFLSSKPLQMREDYAFKVSRLGVPACAGDVVNASLVLAAQTIRRIAALAPDHVLRSVRELIA